MSRLQGLSDIGVDVASKNKRLRMRSLISPTY